MKKLASLILLAALTLTGCVGMPGLGWHTEPEPLPPPAPKEPPPPPIVLPEQVTQQNTANVLQGLKAELDYDSRK
jgi:hypothetical protein